ncbi:MAG: CBS domain-containing protein [Desulfobacterales bacterium]
MPTSEKQNLTIITTHVNADFDAVASMLAAQKLYPGALVVFPGSYEKSLRNFLIDSMAYLFNMVDIKNIDFSTIKRLVLVDTRREDRIGKLSSLLSRPGIEIHVYDHHPPGPDDIKPNSDFCDATGANTTILAKIIEEKKIDLNPDEATIMCLGIYEDTGSFTFSSTTEQDLRSAAFLLSKGANLNVVSDMISKEINPEQVKILNDMLQSATRFKINGVEITSTNVSHEGYIPDFAILVQKMMKMESLNTLFAIARMANKIYIVARSRIPEVDAGEILRPLGGGGHPFAAAVTIRDQTLAQVEHQLFEILYRTIRPAQTAAEIMSSPVISIGPEISCSDAGKQMTRYNVNALLVTEKKIGKERLLGYISRQVVEKALFHDLNSVPVKEYMSTEIASVPIEADIQEIQKKIIENKQRILPVMENGKIKGVITRTNLLNILVDQDFRKNGKDQDSFQGPNTARTRNVRKLMKERLKKNLIDMLKSIGETAAELGFNSYVVGGFVRDLFLYRKNEDIDIVIEGDGIAFAKKYAKIKGARINAYQKFGTAVIIFPDGFKIDVASARMEYYQSPAALPTVEMSSIKLDLFRRDFTINTLAIQLSPDHFGTLIDFFSAQRDLKGKIIRILHNLSFVEDPTRGFRAIRFEQRFGFSIGKLTSGLIENAVKMNFFKQLSGRRLFMELWQIFEEENPTPAIIRLSDYNLLQFIHPSVKMSKNLIRLLNSAHKVITWHDLLFLEESYNKWAVYFLILIRHCDMKTSEEICRHLELSPRHLKFFSNERFEAEKCLNSLERKLPVKNSTIYKKLSVFKTELILYMMATTRQKKVEKAVSFYFTQLRQIKISIKGRDLIQFGIAPGPVYGKILNAVKDQKLNGNLKTKKDELEYAKNYAMPHIKKASGNL